MCVRCITIAQLYMINKNKFLQDYRDTSIKIGAVDGKIFKALKMKAINAPSLNLKSMRTTQYYFCFLSSNLIQLWFLVKISYIVIN